MSLWPTQQTGKEWIIRIMERAGKKNSNNEDWQFWGHQNPVQSGFVTREEERMKGLVPLSYS